MGGAFLVEAAAHAAAATPSVAAVAATPSANSDTFKPPSIVYLLSENRLCSIFWRSVIRQTRRVLGFDFTLEHRHF